MALAVTVAAGITLSEGMNWIPRGSLFFVFVVLGLQSVPVRPDRVHEPLMVAGGVIVLSIGLGMSGWLVRRHGPDWLHQRLPALHRRPVRRLSPMLQRTYWYLAAVNVVGVLAAWAIALALGIGRPYWAAVTVAAVMPTLASLTGYGRMLHRLLGTTAGVGVAATLFAWTPPALFVIVVIAVCSFAAEALVARHYGLALLAITPLAIGATNVAQGEPWGPLLRDRVIETAIGAGVALVIIVVSRAVVRRERFSSARPR